MKSYEERMQSHAIDVHSEVIGDSTLLIIYVKNCPVSLVGTAREACYYDDNGDGRFNKARGKKETGVPRTAKDALALTKIFFLPPLPSPTAFSESLIYPGVYPVFWYAAKPPLATRQGATPKLSSKYRTQEKDA